MAKKEKKKKKKKTALVVCRDRKEFWTTQKQFWQWVREGVIVKTQDQPLTGAFRREHDELMVLVSNTVLNLAHPNHMREALLSRRIGLAGKSAEAYPASQEVGSKIRTHNGSFSFTPCFRSLSEKAFLSANSVMLCVSVVKFLE